jgi:hypothetical protein
MLISATNLGNPRRQSKTATAYIMSYDMVSSNGIPQATRSNAMNTSPHIRNSELSKQFRNLRPSTIVTFGLILRGNTIRLLCPICSLILGCKLS